MFVYLWMSTRVTTVSPETSVREARRIMREQNVRRLPVVKGGELIGLVTESDMLQALPPSSGPIIDWESYGEREDVSVTRIMSTNPLKGHPKMTLAEAATSMAEHKISSLPIVDNNRLVGIITDTDLFTALAGVLEGERKGAKSAFFAIQDKSEVSAVLKLLLTRNVVVLSLVVHPAEAAGYPFLVSVTIEGPEKEDALRALVSAGYEPLKVSGD